MKTIQTSIEIDASPETVWEILTEFPAHAEWNPFFASIDGEAVVGERLKVVARKGEGTGMTFKPIVLEVEPNHRLIWKGSLLVKGVFDGTHSFELLPNTSGGTTLKHGEEFEGLLVRFVGKVLRETEDGFRSFNKAIKERSESAN